MEQELIHKLAVSRVETFNKDAGNLELYDCPICRNKGVLLELRNDAGIYADTMVARPCKCAEIRGNLTHLKRMGLLESVRGSSLKNFDTGEAFQAEMKRRTLDYLKDSCGEWFFVGGQSGCGKTTICQYIYARMLNAGTACYYMPWVSESKRLRRYATDQENFQKHCWNLLHAELLYIDDFLKGKTPTEAELSLAFEIIDHRYKSHRITVVSSERLLSEIDSLDEAIGGRIYEKATERFVLNIQRDAAKNYRKRKSVSGVSA